MWLLTALLAFWALLALALVALLVLITRLAVFWGGAARGMWWRWRLRIRRPSPSPAWVNWAVHVAEQWRRGRRRVDVVPVRKLRR